MMMVGPELDGGSHRGGRDQRREYRLLLLVAPVERRRAPHLALLPQRAHLIIRRLVIVHHG